MANNYLEFSVMLPWPDTPRASVDNFINEYKPADNGEEELDCVFEHRAEGLWLHSDAEWSTPELAANFIQAYLTFFNIDGGIFMSWASYCSKPRINEANGGAVVITKNTQIWVNSYDAWRQAEAAGIKIINEG